MIKKPTYNISGDEIKNTSFDDMTESVESSDVRSGFMYVLIMVLLLVIAKYNKNSSDKNSTTKKGSFTLPFFRLSFKLNASTIIQQML